MTAEHITELAQYIADVVATDGGTVTSVQMGEMADGSRRSFALVNMVDGDHEQEYRVATASPWNSPAWATHYAEPTVEIRTGDSWMTLEYV